jgi:hypothetical protein
VSRLVSHHRVVHCRLLHDLLYAEYVHGSFDDCLFTLNKPHLHNHPYRRLMISEDMDEDRDADEKYVACVVLLDAASNKPVCVCVYARNTGGSLWSASCRA